MQAGAMGFSTSRTMLHRAKDGEPVLGGETDQLIGVTHINDGQEIMLGTAEGYAIRFDESQMRPMGRTARGVRGIKLRENDRVKDMIVVDGTGEVLTLCEQGYGKRTPFGEYRQTNRGGLGIINIRTTERNGSVVGLMTVHPDDEIIMMTQEGKVVRTEVQGIRSTASTPLPPLTSTTRCPSSIV